MTLESLRSAHQAKPFKAITLHLADGRSARISHPEMLFVPPGNTRTIVLATPQGDIRLIDVLMIVEIEIDQRSRRRAG